MLHFVVDTIMHGYNTVLYAKKFWRKKNFTNLTNWYESSIFNSSNFYWLSASLLVMLASP